MVYYGSKPTHYFIGIIMVALCNRADHYILAVVSSSFFLLSSFFPRLISVAVDWMSTILRSHGVP